MFELLQYSVRELNRRPIRTLGVIFCHSLAVAAAVVFITLSSSIDQQTEQVLWDIGAHSVVFFPAQDVDGCCDFAENPDEGFFMNNAPTRLIHSHILDELRKSENILDVSPFLSYKMLSSSGRESWLIGGFDPARPAAFSATMAAPRQVVAGCFISASDKGKVMVEQEFAQVHKLETGSLISLGGTSFEVAAIVAPPLRPGKANIYMDISELRQIIKVNVPATNVLNAVLIESKGALYHEAARADVAAILGDDALISSYGCYQPGMAAMATGKSMAATISILTLVCVLLLSIKTQFATVCERRHDFAILTAIGWPDCYIRTLTGFEALIQASAGIVVGALVSIAMLSAASAAGLMQTLSLSPAPLLMYVMAALSPIVAGVISAVVSNFALRRNSCAAMLREI